MNRRLVLFAVGLTAATVAAMACGSNGDETSGTSSSGGDAGSSSSGSSGSIGFGDAGATPPATGVLMVHAAAFPALRVCFQNYPDLPPQPDARVLPQANVVGLEPGGVVRFGPMKKAPGKVVVIQQETLKNVPGEKQDTCAEFLDKHSDGEKFTWWSAGDLPDPVGTTSAEVIVLTGCGSVSILSGLQVPKADCADYDLNAEAAGNMKPVVFPLTTTTTATDMTLPVALVQMSPKLEDLTPEGQSLDVSFGDLDAGIGAALATPIPADAGLNAENRGVVLPLDQTPSEAIFGTHGFRIAYRGADGTTPDGGFSVDQSLAAVQRASRPDGNPATYFVGATNFALFLLGDPRVKPTYDDGGTNPTYDSRRAVHLVAVPVLDESKPPPLGEDGGADATPAATRGPDTAAEAGQR